MLTDNETRPDREAPRDGETPHASVADAHDAIDTPKQFPTLEEPSWLEDDLDDDMEAPRDSAFRGIWVGVAAAAATFVLVFAIPHWLGWYDLGKPGQPTTRESPESVISTVTAKPSATPADQPPADSAAQPATPAATAPAAPTLPAAAPPTPKAAAPAVTAPTPAAPAHVTPPKAPTHPAPTAVVAKSPSHEKPAKATAASKRTYSVQIAAFKDAKTAGRLADRVKRDGYRADVRRVESSAVPWVVRVGGYPSREQAESARDALARKGFRGFVL
jgi:cell division septation protein DedD